MFPSQRAQTGQDSREQQSHEIIFLVFVVFFPSAFSIDF